MILFSDVYLFITEYLLVIIDWGLTITFKFTLTQFYFWIEI